MLRLPHPVAAGVFDAIRRNVVGARHRAVAGTELDYVVFRSGLDTPDLAFYDEDGTIYIPEDLVRSDEQFADLIGLHEHLEVRHKLAGRPHAYAHRRAWLEEVLAAKRIFNEPSELQDYLRWRIGLYPEWKAPDPEAIVAQLMRVLIVERPRKGELLQVIKQHRL